MFECLVERTEPICQKISKKLASYLIYATSGIELPVKENNPKIYRHRVTVERTIFLFKDTFVLDAKKSHRTVSAKADLYLAGIVQLIGVLLADALHKPEYIRSVRKLLAA